MLLLPEVPKKSIISSLIGKEKPRKISNKNGNERQERNSKETVGSSGGWTGGGKESALSYSYSYMATVSRIYIVTRELDIRNFFKDQNADCIGKYTLHHQIGKLFVGLTIFPPMQ